MGPYSIRNMDPKSTFHGVHILHNTSIHCLCLRAPEVLGESVILFTCIMNGIDDDSHLISCIEKRAAFNNLAMFCQLTLLIYHVPDTGANMLRCI